MDASDDPNERPGSGFCVSSAAVVGTEAGIDAGVKVGLPILNLGGALGVVDSTLNGLLAGVVAVVALVVVEEVAVAGTSDGVAAGTPLEKPANGEGAGLSVRLLAGLAVVNSGGLAIEAASLGFPNPWNGEGVTAGKGDGFVGALVFGANKADANGVDEVVNGEAVSVIEQDECILSDVVLSPWFVVEGAAVNGLSVGCVAGGLVDEAGLDASETNRLSSATGAAATVPDLVSNTELWIISGSGRLPRLRSTIN